MSAFADLVRFRTTLGGTTDWVVSSAIGGCQIPSAANVLNGTNYKVYAVSDDLTQWEISTGAYNSGTTTFPRTTVLYNSSGTGTATGQSGAGTKINFTLAPQVSVVALAEDLISVETANAFTATQQAQARTNVYAAPFDAFGAQGIQINGSMDVSQESATNILTLASGATTFSVDQFNSIYVHGANTAVFTSQQIAPPGSPSFGACFPNCLQLKATTALSSPAAGDLATIILPIEGYRVSRLGFGNANAQSVTVGFWVYATIAGTGTLSIRNRAASNRSYPVNFTVSNPTTWQYITVTIPGDTTGTWLVTTGVGAYVSFAFAAGSTFQGTNATWAAGNFTGTSATTNFFASSNNVVCLTGVVIVPGSEAPSAARSPFIMRPYDKELILCQRYFRKSFPQATACAQNAGVAGAITIKNPIALGDPAEFIPFSPTMRAAPTITTFNPSASNANWRDITAASDVTVSVDPATTISDGGVLLATSGTVANLGDILAIHYKADARLS